MAMARRGVIPLLLATTFGVINGYWVFSPAFKEQENSKRDLSEQPLDTPAQIEHGIDSLKTSDVVKSIPSDSAVTGPTLESKGASKSWWPKMSLWAQPEPEVIVSKITPSPTSPSSDTQSKSEENRTS